MFEIGITEMLHLLVHAGVLLLVGGAMFIQEA